MDVFVLSLFKNDNRSYDAAVEKLFPFAAALAVIYGRLCLALFFSIISRAASGSLPPLAIYSSKS